MFCPKCSEKCEEEDVFCRKCGTRLHGETISDDKTGAVNSSDYTNNAHEEIPTEEHEWRYSPRDMLDETFWGVILFLIGILLAVWITRTFNFTGIPSGFIWGTCLMIPIIYAVRNLWIFFIRHATTLYRLTPKNFIHQTGFFRQKKDIIELYDIEQVSVIRTLWERILGVGSVQLRIKGGQIDSNAFQPNTTSQVYLFRGIREYDEMADTITKYRDHLRARRGVTML